MPKLLALDLSTTTLGYSVYCIDEKKILEVNYYNFQTGDALLDKANELTSLLSNINIKYPGITEFVIEERLKSFRAGGTNAEAMIKLASFNFCSQYIASSIYKWNIKEINVNTARKECFPSFHSIARKIKNQRQKEIAFEMAVKMFPDVVFPTKTMKSGKNKGTVQYLKEAGDMADALILMTAAIKIFQY